MPTTPVAESAFLTGVFDKLPILEAATTSRVVVNNAVLRHVVFSFDAGQVLTEHASPRAVVVQMLSGKMRFRVGEATHDLAGGDVVYLAPGGMRSRRSTPATWRSRSSTSKTPPTLRKKPWTGPQKRGKSERRGH